MKSGSGYREELRGKLRAAYSREMQAKGVAFARTAKGVEASRRVHDRGVQLTKTANSAYEKHRKERVLNEFRKLQLRSWGAKPELKPNWARSVSRVMQQAEKNVFERHHNRLLKIDNITRREIARVRREFEPIRRREK